MRVRFLRNYDHRPHPSQVYAYKAGWEGTIKKEWAEAAISAGAAEKISPPVRETIPPPEPE